MNHHELLDIIGEVNETYVLAADQPVKRVRSRWQTWAACAACAALMIGAYPAYRALQPKQPPLHSYTVVEDGLGRPTENSGSEKLPYSGSGDVPMDSDGTQNEPERIPYHQKALAQYDNLIRNAGISDDGEGGYPAWYGGSWLDNDWPDNISRLTVAIVDGFRTPEMEAQILEWCGGTGDVLFTSVKYSYAHLIQLGDEIWESGLRDSIPDGFGCRPDVMANCLRMDVYGESIPEDALAVLAELDPDGDAIQVRVSHNEDIDVPVDEDPYQQYNSLYENALQGELPAWYGGSYNDYSDSGEPSKLVVCIVDGYRTPELEQQITDWCGGGALAFRYVKYSRGFLQERMEKLSAGVLPEGIALDFGVNDTENCISMNVFAETIPEELLAVLAEYDPDGDVIQVRLHTKQSVNPDVVKGPEPPAPGGAQDDQPADAPDEAADTPESAMPAATENSLPQAKYDLLPLPDGENG